MTVHDLRKLIQANAKRLQPDTALTDICTETDEMFQNAGEKGERHDDPNDPPRRRGNKRRGHGTYDNDRPPIVGTMGRESQGSIILTGRRSRRTSIVSPKQTR